MAQIEAQQDVPSSVPPRRKRVARFPIGKIARYVGVVAASLMVGIMLAMGWTAYREVDPSAESFVVATTAENASTASTFGDDEVSSDMRTVADWIAASANNTGLPYLIVDKRAAAVYVFSSGGAFVVSSVVLLGASTGDTTVAGIGERPLSKVMPYERITPAGRFMGERGHNTRGEDVVWLDYAAGISMHRVLTTNISENRLLRLATPDTKDNRISYGCINVPDAFFNRFIEPIFAKNHALVYVLPEVKTAQQVFGS